MDNAIGGTAPVPAVFASQCKRYEAPTLPVDFPGSWLEGLAERICKARIEDIAGRVAVDPGAEGLRLSLQRRALLVFRLQPQKLLPRFEVIINPYGF